ncbi:sulfotransferase domain-containing protein [cf. Phormidesmis sp. LEGE 11477]|uniref:sulfotransferase domain-containing protein n=1 Tax=cf. Phormidesmis sp. LEGE 11477 TaxID=1828680 RepID=UPI0019E204DB|nr:sulfotransferase domain-containing protein [cf. Phormidesmis sp. LEGE 11477]MBE9061256.1 sulfotransferase domain-containing protein [cf. Phormidesmis sp. LEGE 11477]
MTLALLSLPYKMYRKKITDGDVIYGFRMYDRPLVISYSRSGMNWLRYSAEYLTGHPTPGHQRLLKSGDGEFLFDRAHKGFMQIDKYEKVLLLVRNYKECLVRHLSEEWKAASTVTDFLEGKSALQPAYWYIKNLQAYDKFRGEKALLYYEDLVTQPASTLSQFLDFMDFSHKSKSLEEFKQDLSFHKQRSISLYTDNQQSVTLGDEEQLRYHSKKALTPEERNEFDLYYQSRYPKLYKKYLARYSEPHVTA